MRLYSYESRPVTALKYSKDFRAHIRSSRLTRGHDSRFNTAAITVATDSMPARWAETDSFP